MTRGKISSKKGRQAIKTNKAEERTHHITKHICKTNTNLRFVDARQITQTRKYRTTLNQHESHRTPTKNRREEAGNAGERTRQDGR